MNRALVSLRALWAARVPAAAVLVLLALLAALLTAWPRLEHRANADQATATIADTGASVRAVFGSVDGARVGTPLTWDVGLAGGEPAQAWERLTDGISQIGLEQPEPLRTALGAPELQTLSRQFALPITPGVDVRRPDLYLGAAPGLLERAQIVAGRAPQPLPGPVPWYEPIPPGQNPTLTIEVALAAESARTIGWEVGTTRALPTYAAQLELLLVGTYEARDASDDYWQLATLAAGPRVVEDLNLGTAVTVLALLHPDAWWPLMANTEEPSRLNLWWAPAPQALAAAGAQALLPQTRALTSRAYPIGEQQTAERVQLSTQLPDVLVRVEDSQDALGRIVSVVAAGPLAVALGVVIQLAATYGTRRRAALGVALARGAAPLALRVRLGAELGALTLVGVALGVGVGLLVTRDAGGSFAAALPALIALAVLPALVAAATSLHPPGSAPSVASGILSIARDVGIIALAVVTAVAVRSASEDSGASGDLMIVLAPAIVAAGLAVLLLRSHRLLGLLARGAARGRGLVAWLGSATSARSGARGWATFGAVVATATAVLGATLAGTLNAGLTQEAWQRTGADLSINGPHMGPDTVSAVRAIDGVAAAVAIATSSRTIPAGDDPVTATVIEADAAAYGQVAAGAPDRLGGGTVADVADWAADAQRGPGAGTALATPGLAGAILTTPAGDVELVAGGDVLPGAGMDAAQWVLVDSGPDGWAEPAGTSPQPRTLLVRLAPGADAAELTSQILAATGGGAVTSAEAVRSGGPSAAALSLLRLALGGSIAAAGLLGLAGLILVLVGQAPARRATNHALSLLGLRRGHLARLAWWELLPWAVPALVAGAALGVVGTRALPPTGIAAFGPAVAQRPAWSTAVGYGLAVLAVAILLTIALTLVLVVRTGARRTNRRTPGPRLDPRTGPAPATGTTEEPNPIRDTQQPQEGSRR